jgi:hypothetical protein
VRKTVEFGNCECLGQTELAIYVLIKDPKCLICANWIPLSQIDEDSEVRKTGDIGLITITRWWAEKQGLV